MVDAAQGFYTKDFMVRQIIIVMTSGYNRKSSIEICPLKAIL